MTHLVIFASGSGSNFRSILESIHSGNLDAKITGLITNRDNIGAISIAESNHIPYQVINQKDFHTQDDYELKLLTQCKQWDAHYLICAGYLRKIPDLLIAHYHHRILNIHPSLLPKYGGQGYYGIRVHTSVIENGEKESGCTIHLVTSNYDEGPILAQESVVVTSEDTPQSLAAKILMVEHRLYPKTIQQFIHSSTNH